MCLSLYDYQSKARRYRKGLTYLKNRATTNQKHAIDSRKPKIREHKHKIKGNHQTTKRNKEKETKNKHRINWKTRFEMAINTYVSIITLNVNGLNASIKRHRVENSLAVQWLGLCASTAVGMGSLPGQGTKIPQATWHSQKKKKKKTDWLTE